jgi:rhodanese-related sulfurtransferase
VTFFTNPFNLALIVIVLVSGVMLLWPTLTRRNQGLASSEAILLINRRNAAVIDIRTAEAYAAGHLPQARHVAFADLAGKAPLLAKNKATPVILICQNGQQSNKALDALKQAGYSEVHALEGGLDGWKKAGLPVVASKA